MELNFEQSGGEVYELLKAETLTCEESGETIVPDSCPDIDRILDCGATVLLRSRECQGGRLNLSGTVRCRIVCMPEGEDRPRSMELAIPFGLYMESEGISADSVAVVRPSVSSAQPGIVNPRKLSMRVGVSVYVEVYDKRSHKTICGVTGEGAEGVQLLREKEQYRCASAWGEKLFTVTDRLELPAGSPKPEEIMRLHGAVELTETRIVGGRVVFKGNIIAHVNYVDENGQLTKHEFRLPFSQLVELEGAEEDDEAEVAVAITGFELEKTETPGQLELSMNMLAQAVAFRESRQERIVDMYSTKGRLTPKTGTETIMQRTGSRRLIQSGRQMLELPSPASAVLDATLWVSDAQAAGDGELETNMEASVVYLDLEGQLRRAARSFTEVCSMDGCEDGSHVIARPVGEVQATPVGDRVELRYELDYNVFCSSRQTRQELLGAELEELEQAGDGPALLLRRANKGESLWSVAKSCMTTVDSVCQANELGPDAALSGGELLLIPMDMA